MLRKVSVFLIVALLLSIPMAGTGASSPAQEKPFEGVVLNAYFIGGGAYEKLYTKIPEFEEETGAKVNIAAKLSHFELNKRVAQEFATGGEIDVISTHTTFAPGQKEFLLALNDYLTKEDLADFQPSTIEASTVGGNLIMLPRHTDVRIMYYRTDLFEDPDEQAAFKEKYGYELRPPTTWEEMLDVAEFFTRPPELYGFVFTGGEEPLVGTFYEFTMSAGGDFFDEEMNVIFNQEPGQKALQLLVDLYYNKKTTPEGVPNYRWDEVAKAFRDGQIAFHFDWPGWYTLTKDPKESKVADKFGLASYPVGPAGYAKIWGGSHGFAVAKATKNPEAAVALIKFLTSSENLYFEAKEGGFLPTSISAFSKIKEDAAATGDPLDLKRLELLEEELAGFVPPPKIPEYQEVVSAMWPELQKSLVEGRDVKETLDIAAEKVQKIVSPK